VDTYRHAELTFAIWKCLKQKMNPRTSRIVCGQPANRECLAGIPPAVSSTVPKHEFESSHKEVADISPCVPANVLHV
jgi:hypothetical protein